MSKKILVIDDEESIRYTFHSFLSAAGYDVLTAEDYESALHAIMSVDVDLVFADIILRGHTGIDILQEIKARGMLCPVIVITGVPNIETAAEAVRLGAFDYLPKPIRKDELLRVTAQAIQYKVLIDEKGRIESEKEKYHRILDAIFRSLKDAIVTVDQNLRVIEVNEASRTICGLDPSEILGKCLSDISIPCAKSCHKVLRETLRTKNTIKEYRVECGRQAHAGQVVLLTSSPLADRDNRFIGAVLVIRDVTRLNDLERELRERHRFRNIIGKSEKMQEIYSLVEELANTPTTVLITGASGTGKELIAEALHYHGLRAFRPFVKVNCSALAENLLESELFGHVKGAFTGAVRDKQGRFEVAKDGTLFLDEIGDITPRIGLKLLRVLEQKEFERVGDSEPIKVDVRLIAATNADLKEKVRLGEFREDLYYRLKVVEIRLPELRERREDIPLLMEYFLDRFNENLGKSIEGFSDEVFATFMHYSWPGNVRELEHAIEHAFVVCRDRHITIGHLPPEMTEHDRLKGPHWKRGQDEEPRKTLEALQKTGWNKARAARLLGLSRQTIYRRIVKHNLKDPHKKV